MKPSEESFVTDIQPKMSDRRTFLRVLTAGTVITVLGGAYIVVGDEATRRARKMKLPDGRPRLPPGQSVIQRLRPMGGQEGDPSPGAFKLKVHGFRAGGTKVKGFTVKRTVDG
jgi:hypothetical protein